MHRLREQGFLVLTVAQGDAAAIRLPPGHPREKVVYVGHPARPTEYLPVGQFHRHVFEDKVAEAMRLLMGLGAVSISVEHIAGWDATSGLDIDVPTIGNIKAGGKVVTTKQTGRRVMLEARLQPGSQPAIQPGLVWYGHEPLWRALAEARLAHGLQSFNLDVRYDDDYGIHAGLKVSVQKVGLELGADFENHQATVWRMSGDFAKG